MDRDTNEILRQVMSLNGMTHKDICYICNRSESTVFKWLNCTLKPDAGSMIQIYQALLRSKRRIPRELDRFESAHFARAVAWSKDNKSGSEKAEFVGEKMIEHKEAALFVYRCELMTRQQIAKLSGLKYQTVYIRTKTALELSDVSKAIDRKKWARKL